MAKEVKSVQLTGGAGFAFEDCVASLFLAALASGAFPFGSDIGKVTRLDWQTRGDGWLLDDLGVSIERPDSGVLALSIKSDRQVTRGGFPASFVEAAREQWGSQGEDSPFRADRDLLGLGVGELAQEVNEAWNNLLRQSLAGDPKRVGCRYTSEEGSGDTGRALFQSLLSADDADASENVRFIRHIRLLHFDFNEAGSRSQGQAIQMCQLALASGNSEEAVALWHRLVSIAAERRALGGSLAREGLVKLLRPDFLLAEFPDHSASWAALDRRSAEKIDSVADSIGGKLSLLRSKIVAESLDGVRRGRCVLLTGDAGSGKSAIAKRLAVHSGEFDRCLWLDGAALNHSSFSEMEKASGVAVSMRELLANSSSKRACLVLDGLETFTVHAKNCFSSLLACFGSDPALRGWSVIVTTRPQGVAEARRLFKNAGVMATLIYEQVVPTASDQECATVLAQVPALKASLVGRELRAALRNLKVLDWIVTAGDELRGEEVRNWIGITDVAESLWQRWVGIDASAAARAGLMKKLARIEGEGVGIGVGLSNLEATEHQILGILENDDLIAIREERVVFRHDMLGDWARLRILIETVQDDPTIIAHSAELPRWHDAIRLFGQRCLERDVSPPNCWLEHINRLEGDAPATVVARDLMVESVIISAGAADLIELAWSSLVSDGGVLLRRMLKRFLYVATVPDPRIADAVTDADEASDMAAYWRFPWWPLWPDPLRVLASHASEVAKVAPVEGAAICGLWLRNMPQGARGRLEAATLALAIGRETQAARGEGLRYYDRRDQDKTIFEAVLFSAIELPDPVVELCLQLSTRLPAPPDVVARAEAYQERMREEAARRRANQASRPSGMGTPLLFDRGRLREQFPDGPADHVDDGLQTAVHGTLGILAVASVRPDQAREILLACSLEAPRHEQLDDYDPMDSLGIGDVRGDYHQPMFFKGPWLQLLRQNPHLGVDCVVRLANPATATWERRAVTEDATPEVRRATRVMVECSKGSVECVGDLNVFGWYRDRLCRAHLLTSALMAIEKWFYERLENGETIDDVICQILDSGRSAALLGVLVAVGKYKPQLFTGILRPLLSIWQLYEWDLRLSMDRDLWQIGFFQWTRSGEQTFNAVRDWHTMPHRKRLLRDTVVGMILTNTEMQEHFQEVRNEWQKVIDDGVCGDHELLELMIARCDPKNYTARERDDGSVEVSLEWPEHLRERTEKQLVKSSAGSRMLAFPYKCRELLDKREELSDAEAEEIWESLNWCFEQPPKEDLGEWGIDRRPDALVGGIAVLVSLAPDWLKREPAREQWCGEVLEEILANPPAASVVDNERSISTDRWHSFWAEIVIAEFSVDPEEADRRAYAAEVVMSFWYATTGVAMKAADQYRGAIGQDFGRLANLAVLCSALRCIRMSYGTKEEDRRIANARWSRLRGAFVRREIPSSMLDWDAIGAIAVRAQERLRKKRHPEYYSATESERGETRRSEAALKTGRTRRRTRSHPGFDTECLAAAFSWLTPPGPSDNVGMRAEKVDWVKQLLWVTLSTLPSHADEGDDEVDGTPYDYDATIFQLVAKTVSRLRRDERPEELWQPILELGPGAHYWVESFLGDWTVSALPRAESPEMFFERWREMMEFAINSPLWMPTSGRWGFRLGDMWQHLLGMHLGAPIVGAAEHQAHFEALVPYYRKWAQTFLCEDRSLLAFAHFLRQPGTKPLRCPAVPWLLRAAEQVSAYEWDQDPIADEVASTLRLIWREDAAKIAGDGENLKAFLSLLNLLVTQQSVVAMDLRDRVVRAVPTQSAE